MVELAALSSRSGDRAIAILKKFFTLLCFTP